ncbi:MAG: NHL repeat-containing protein [Candidatus Marinimicrobia bacterium]|nr:NHL repeat-containing protein [Candidatus Neomarinimicrobiota bacterium]
MKKIIFTIAITSMLIFITCDFNPVALPESQDSSLTFNTGETKWVQLNPGWEGFNNPQDIVIAPDKYIYVSDKGNNRIAVLNKSGQEIHQDNFGNDFSALYDLNAINSHQIEPMGLAIDSKLSLFITDSSNMIYCWNQYLNYLKNTSESPDSIAEYFVYKNVETSELDTVYDPVLTENYNNYDYRVEDIKFSPLDDDSIYAPHVFYENEDNANYVAVTAAPDSNCIYAASTSDQRIHKINMVRSAYIKFDNITIWRYRGVADGYIATNGTGAGTVNDPTGMTIDQNSAVYYTQTGENFGFHKIRRNSDNVWTSMFSLNEDEIMDLERFDDPQDVTVDAEGNIYVLNSGDNEIQQFDFSGQFVRKAGLREETIDTTLIDTVYSEGDTSFVEKDTIVTKYHNDLLNQPEGISFDDGILYIANTGNNTIVRFQLSTDLDVNLEEDQ